MRHLIKKLLLLLMLVYPLTGVAQTEVISEKYKLEKKCLNKEIVKNNRYSYHHIGEFYKLKDLELTNKINQKSVDFSVFRNKVDGIKFRNEVLNTVNKLLSLHEKKLLSENQCNLFFAFYIDESYKTIMVEIVSNNEVDNILTVRKIVKIIDKIKKKRLDGIIPIPKGNYIKLTIVRRYNA